MQTAEETVSPTPERAAKGQVRQVPTDKAGVMAHVVVDDSDLVGYFLSIGEKLDLMVQTYAPFRITPQQADAARSLQELYDRTGRSVAHAQRLARVDVGYDDGMSDDEAFAFGKWLKAIRRMPPNSIDVVLDVVIMNQRRDRHMDRLRAGLDAISKDA